MMEMEEEQSAYYHQCLFSVFVNPKVIYSSSFFFMMVGKQQIVELPPPAGVECG